MRRDMVFHSSQFTIFGNDASDRLVGKRLVTPVDKEGSGLLYIFLKSFRIAEECI